MDSSAWKYIDELAGRIKRILLVFIISLLVFLALPAPNPFDLKTSSIFFYDTLIFWLIRTMEVAYLPQGAKIFSISITSPLFSVIQMALYLALAITIPYAFKEIYAFISPALYKREKKVIRKYLLPFGILYVTGAIYTTIFILPLTFRALIFLYEPLNIELLINLNDFINMVVLMVILGGVLFSLPTLILPLIEAGILKVRTLSKNRVLIYLIVAFIAGLISPDPTFLSVIPLLIPVYVLYEGTIIIGKKLENKQ
ncbi:MAG TPA: twin-arginine translocase subunit TatC [Geobacterales bacterium]|nr:twin-arginine translocase subunit TatC [Geobacterales bacterium]